ncbi:hypothetical protein ACX0G9_09505 [Flavitalea flava]
MLLNKRMLLLSLSMCWLSVTMAQLKPKVKCPDFTVDILNGTVNGLKPNRTLNEVKTEFPCSTSVEEEGTNAKCGAGVFYKDKDIFFYIKRSYIQIGPKFQGKLSLPLLGAKRNSLFKWLGNPKMKDDLWDAFQMQYGSLVLHYDNAGANGKVKLFQFSTLGVELLDLCE